MYKGVMATVTMVLWLFIFSYSHASETINARGLTGGATRALDSYSVNDISNNDRAIVVYTSGASAYIGFYQYDSSGTTDENTSDHPFYVRPDDYSTSGVWVENPFSWVDLGATLTLVNLTVTDLTVGGTNAVVNLDASGRLSGSLPITDIVTGTVTLSGVSQLGGMVSNCNATSAVTAVLGTASKGDSVIFSLCSDMISGSTMWVQVNSSDKIVNSLNFVTGTGTGTSYYFLSNDETSGVTGEGISLIAIEDNKWYVYEDGSPTQGSIE